MAYGGKLRILIQMLRLGFAEDEPLPGDWKRMPEFDRLLLFRALRPDRLTAAMRKFVTNMIGAKYVTSQPYDLERSFQDSSPGTPIFVFLSPGVDVVSGESRTLRRLPQLLLQPCLLANQPVLQRRMCTAACRFAT